MRFRQYWMWVIVIGVLLGSSGCGLLDEAGDSTDVPATAAPYAEGICGGGPECQAPSNPDRSINGFTWFYDNSEAGCSTTGEGIPVGLVPVSCSEWSCPAQTCGEGEEYEATCPPAPTGAPGQTCYHGGPVMAVPIPGWGSIGYESTPAATSNIETATNTPNGVDASTPTPTCDPETGDGGVAATPTPTPTITPEGSVTLTPTPYTFATNCGACMLTEIAYSGHVAHRIRSMPHSKKG